MQVFLWSYVLSYTTELSVYSTLNMGSMLLLCSVGSINNMGAAKSLL